MSIALPRKAGRKGARTLKNLELKARLHDPSAIRQRIEQFGCQKVWQRHQHDTYLRVPTGKLKLRQQDQQRAELIFYHRPEQSSAKISQYEISIVDDSPSMLRLLQAAFGVHLVIDKTRSLYLWHNVRIHLDTVQDLGDFIEFEAVLDENNSEEISADRIAELSRFLQIEAADRIACGYYELLLERE